jgi:hypothetical protein
MEINGKTCYFYNTWITADIPEECKECDCNCNNDCKDCEICSAQGTCEPDPDCDVTVNVRVEWGGGLYNGAYRAGGIGCRCAPSSGTYVPLNSYTIQDVDPDNESYYFKQVASGTTSVWPEDICRADCGIEQGFPTYPYTTYRLYKVTKGVGEQPFSDTSHPGGIQYSTTTSIYSSYSGGAQWDVTQNNYGNTYWENA